MADPIMIKCRLNGNVIDIKENSTQSGAPLDAFPPKAAQSLSGPTTFAANQTWEVQPDPAGSPHFIIQNPATGFCIDIQSNSVNRGAALDAFPAKTSGNQNQLWDFLPDPFGSEYFFIQNPQTGYVIEVENGSTSSGASLVVNPRRLFDNSFQLWAGVEQNWGGATLPALTLASPTADLRSTAQYVLFTANPQTTNLTAITVTLDIIEDLVTDSFSVQINGNPPYPGPEGVTYDAQWLQFLLVMQNNSLFLVNQLWHAPGPDPPGNPLASEPVPSGSMLQLQNNTVPAGTRIVLTLDIYPNNDYVYGIHGKVYDKSDNSIGKLVDWQVVGQPTFNPGGPVKESDLAPLGAFQVVVVGPPGSHTNFTSGMGTITVTCNPDISAQLYWPNPTDPGTGETSNCYYGKVQTGYYPQIAQPFGLPSPQMTAVSGDYTFAGTGLLPDSKLTATATFHVEDTAQTVPGIVSPAALVSQNDGSFSLIVTPQDPSVLYEDGWVTTTVTDANGNWAQGVVRTNVPPSQLELTSTGGLGT
jgi:Ricin-type beta-trefoil lectin domain-like